MLAAFTILLAFFTLALWAATSKIAEVARSTARKELRAYVGIKEHQIRVTHDGKLIASVDYANMGKTPAHDVELRMSARVFDFGIKQPPWEAPKNIEGYGKGGVILPSVVWQRNCLIEGYFDGLKEALEGQKKRIWVWGTITYVDIFTKNCFVQFRMWSAKDFREHIKGMGFALIPDIEHTKATYGED